MLGNKAKTKGSPGRGATEGNGGKREKRNRLILHTSSDISTMEQIASGSPKEASRDDAC